MPPSASPRSDKSANAHRIPSLDGLRAVSIVMVITAHFAMAYGRHARPGSMMASVVGFLNLGPLGVTVFFVISGYLITHLLLIEMARTGTINLARFYFRRTLRIFPPLYVLLAVLFVCGATGIASVTIGDLWPAATYVSDYVSTGWFTRHTWSLAVEEQFYLLWPLCLRFGSIRNGKLLCLAVMCLAPATRFWAAKNSPHVARFFCFHEVADSLATGCFLAILRAQGSQLYAKLLSYRFELPVIALVFALAIWPSHPSVCPVGFYSTVCISAINVGIGIILVCVVHRTDGWLSWILNTPTLVAVGVLSYSLYLWQQCFTGLDDVANGWRTVINLVLIGAAAALSYWFVERPSLRLKARWECHLFGGEDVESFRVKSLCAQMNDRT